jgi:hypothetical protein
MNAYSMSPNKHKALRRLLTFHGFITLAAAMVLTVAPGVIPNVIGIHLGQSAYMVAYLLAGAEFGFAMLSFGGECLLTMGGAVVLNEPDAVGRRVTLGRNCHNRSL